MPNRREVRGLLLAGGRSKRMGRDKRLILVNGEPMIVRAHRALSEAFGAPWVLVASEEDAAALSPLLGHKARFLFDETTESGPLAATLSALEILDRPFAFLLAADMPGVTSSTLRRFDLLRRELRDTPDAIVARASGHLQVMCAFYKREIARHLKKSIKVGGRCLAKSIERAGANVHYLDEREIRSVGGEVVFHNMNTPADIERYSSEEDHDERALPSR